MHIVLDMSALEIPDRPQILPSVKRGQATRLHLSLRAWLSRRDFDDPTKDRLRTLEPCLTLSNLRFVDALLLFDELKEALQGDEYHDERGRLLALARLDKDEDLLAALEDIGALDG